jgi:2-keto-4-pentenoate hydratase/2-oxohepta-3-ene-1,7-dioic acid hydratase in catechol pathway
MRILRVEYQGLSFYARLEDDTLYCLDASKGLSDPIALEDVTFLSPVTPTKVICLAVNYRAHAAEVGREIPDEPVLFLKPPSAVIKSGDPIILPLVSNRVDFEGELVVVMGRHCKNLKPEEVPANIFGYTCGLDITARDLQQKDGLFARAKGFDTFAPIGPWIETHVPDPNNIEITTSVNGEIKQQGNTSDMIFSTLEAVSSISQVMTLFPGDVIFTGTPPGIGPLAEGDEVRVDIEGVGMLINSVVAEKNQSSGASSGGTIH